MKFPGLGVRTYIMLSEIPYVSFHFIITLIWLIHIIYNFTSKLKYQTIAVFRKASNISMLTSLALPDALFSDVIYNA